MVTIFYLTLVLHDSYEAFTLLKISIFICSCGCKAKTGNFQMYDRHRINTIPTLEVLSLCTKGESVAKSGDVTRGPGGLSGHREIKGPGRGRSAKTCLHRWTLMERIVDLHFLKQSLASSKQKHGHGQNTSE